MDSIRDYYMYVISSIHWNFIYTNLYKNCYQQIVLNKYFPQTNLFQIDRYDDI